MTGRGDDQTTDLRRLTRVAARALTAPRRGATSRVEEALLGALMRSPALRVGLFRVVEAYPSLREPQQTLDRVVEELGRDGVPALLRTLVRAAAAVPGGAQATRGIADAAIERTALRFIAGRDPEAAMPVVRRLWLQGTGVVVDALGEKTVTPGESDRYAERVTTLVTRLGAAARSWPEPAVLARDHHGPLPPVAVAVKPTALSPLFAPTTPQRGLDDAAGRLAPILRAAAEHDVFVWFDMEHHAVKDLTDRLFRRLAEAVDHADIGIVVQAYLRDGYEDLQDLLAWAGRRPRPIGVRLVKGAYWDHETVTALAQGWPVPVFAQKWASDANYDRCAELMNQHADTIRPAYASHNVRSLARALAHARLVGLPREAVEVQVLYGMAGTLPEALHRLGIRTRVYVPIGELVPGMSYLVRRLLENTSNESFLRQAGRAELDELLAGPPPLTEAEPPPSDLDPRVSGSDGVGTAGQQQPRVDAAVRA